MHRDLWYNIAKYYLDPPMKFKLFVEENIDKVNWYYLSWNPNAIPLLEKNLDKISWFWISRNPNIFEIDQVEFKLIKYNWIKSLGL